MDRLEDLKEKVRKFRDDRNWSQFHNHKDLALSISIEASELLEHFHWKNGSELDAAAEEKRQAIEEELADVFVNTILLADKLEMDLVDIASRKLAKNEAKYPVEKSMGKSAKYSEL